ncbi:MAG: hypothetical protein VX589_16560 [Myxococcota bacterium]|nr:hypothetical protein [Myxococcota bacterium]
MPHRTQPFFLSACIALSLLACDQEGTSQQDSTATAGNAQSVARPIGGGADEVARSTGGRKTDDAIRPQNAGNETDEMTDESGPTVAGRLADTNGPSSGEATSPDGEMPVAGEPGRAGEIDTQPQGGSPPQDGGRRAFMGGDLAGEMAATSGQNAMDSHASGGQSAGHDAHLGGLMNDMVSPLADSCEGLYVSDADILATEDHRWIADLRLGAASRVSADCGGHGPEVILPWIVPRDGRYLITTMNGTSNDTVLAVKPTCGRQGEVLACNDNLSADSALADGPTQSAVVIDATANQELFIYIDSHDRIVHAPIRLSIIHVAPPQNPIIDVATAAFDGNRIRVGMTGRSTTGQIRRVSVQFDADDIAIGSAETHPLHHHYGQLAFVDRFEINGPGDVVPTHVTLIVEEDDGRNSAPVRIPIEARAERVLGQSCDPGHVLTRCIDNGVCRAMNQRATCIQPTRPRITDAQAWHHDGQILVEFSGRDDDDDAVSVTGVGLIDTGGDFDTVGDQVTSRVFTLTSDDGQFNGQARFELSAFFIEGIRLFVSDEQLLESNAIDVTFQQPVQVGMDAPCDVDNFKTACPVGTLCRAMGTTIQCRPLIRPIMTSLVVRVNDLAGTIGIRIEGVDGDQDIATFSLILLDESGRHIHRVSPRFFDTLTLTGANGFQAAWSGATGQVLTGATRVEVVVRDWSGLNSPPFETIIDAPKATDAAELCDPYEAWTRCGLEQACLRNEDGEPRCQPSPIPVIDDGRLHFNTDTDGIGIELAVRPGASELVGFEIELLDAQGVSVLYPEAGPSLRLPFDSRRSADNLEIGRFQASLTTLKALANGNGSSGRPVTVRIRAVNASGQLSEPLEQALSAPPQIEAEAPCDPIGGFERCEEAHKCLRIDDDEEASPVCWRITEECGADWPLTHLFEPEQETWQHQGRIALGERRFSISCGLSAPARIARFTAPTADTYVFSVTPIDNEVSLPFPGLSLRHRCIDIDTEFECVADSDSTKIATELEAGQTVFAFVSAQPDIFDFRPETGFYDLRVERHHPLEVMDATVWFNPERGTFEIAIEGIFNRFKPVTLVTAVFDEGGQAVILHNGENTVRTGGRFPIVDEADGMKRFTGQVTFTVPEEWAVSPETLATITRVQLTIIDDVDIASLPIERPLIRAVEAPDGEPCDALGARQFCRADSLCISNPVTDGGPLMCYPIVDQCPNAWTIYDLNEHLMNGEWVYDGDLNRVMPALEFHGRPTCAPRATGFNDLFEFTAPAAGSYRFETTGPMVDTIIWARSACALPTPAYELDCNDDDPLADRSELSRIQIRLNAGEQVYLFVDSYGPEGRGTYSLRAYRLDE